MKNNAGSLWSAPKFKLFVIIFGAAVVIGTVWALVG